MAVGEQESYDSYVLSSAGAVGLRVLSFTLLLLLLFWVIGSVLAGLSIFGWVVGGVVLLSGLSNLLFF